MTFGKGDKSGSEERRSRRGSKKKGGVKLKYQTPSKGKITEAPGKKESEGKLKSPKKD